MQKNELVNIYSSLLKHKFKIFFLIVTSTLLMGIYVFTINSIYESNISLYPKFGKSNLSNNLGTIQNLATTVGLNLPNTNNELFDVKDIIYSKKILREILLNEWTVENEKQNLIEFWGINSPGIIDKILPIRPIDEVVKKENELFSGEKILKNRISFRKDETGLNIIKIKMEDPILASDIANFISTFLQDFIKREINLQASINRSFLEDRLITAKDELSDSEVKLKEYQEKFSLTNDSPQNLLLHGRLIRDIEVNQQVYITLKQQFELAKIEELREKPIINVLDYGIPSYIPVFPKKIKLIIISLIISFIGFTYLFYLKDRFDNLDN